MIDSIYIELAQKLELVQFDLSEIDQQIWIDKKGNQFKLCEYGFYPAIIYEDLKKIKKKIRKSKPK